MNEGTSHADTFGKSSQIKRRACAKALRQDHAQDVQETARSQHEGEEMRVGRWGSWSS